ncbi:MAG TPA: protein kinase [Ktedonobacteraceae bacterium]|nr:protein kinase [Ktedonobacteraceae bacterium]
MIDESLVGQQIGNYQLIEAIARGSYGGVYLGQHWLFRDELAVAVKLLYTHLDGQEKRELFLREAYLLRKLKHPHILPLIDAGVHRGIPYLVTVYASGGSLRQVLQEQQERPFPLDIALHILAQVGTALDYAHRQHVVHRDLKPENILFGTQGEIFLADFGLAVSLEAETTGFVGSHGTPLYMAPEQFEGLISPKSDQYALACLGYELLAGRRPFMPQNPGWETIWFHHTRVAPPLPTQFNKQIPAHIEQALLRGLAKDRADRYSSVAAFLEALSQPANALSALSSVWHLPASPLWEQDTVDTPPDLPVPEAKPDVVRSPQVKAQGPPTDVVRAVDMLDLLNQSEEYRKQGHAFRDAGVYDRALQAYEQAIQLNPENPLAYYGQAKIFWEQQRYEEALKIYDEIVRLSPKDPFFQALKGDALYELGHYTEALAAYDQALALKQDNASWHARRASILYQLQMYVEALHAYDLAIALRPGEAYYYGCKGDILSDMKHDEEALRMYAKAVELDPRESWLKSHKSYIRREI